MEEDVEFNRMQNTIAALVRAAAAMTTDDEAKAKQEAVAAWTADSPQ